jgi:tetratricopeptide (TPR) repeat protein
MANAEEHRIREYLLGRLTDAEEEQVELRLLTEPDFAEEYDIVVDELMDDYLAGKFEGEELKQVEEHFLKSNQRRDKLKFAFALKKRNEARIKPPKRNPFTRYLAIAASLVLLAGGGLYLWQVSSRNAELNKGLAALQSAFRDERPLEARLSGFSYAPLSNQRGGPARVDYVQRDRAASLLLNAVREHPTAASYHALGKYYLAERQFDKAIDQLKAALELDPKNAKIHSDLGAAWLEKGKIDRDGLEPVKGTEELGRSLENLNQALALNPNLPEALFNRALYYEYLVRPKEAGDDWRRYLQLDSGSAWAAEANQHMKRL